MQSLRDRRTDRRFNKRKGRKRVKTLEGKERMQQKAAKTPSKKGEGQQSDAARRSTEYGKELRRQPRTKTTWRYYTYIVLRELFLVGSRGLGLSFNLDY